MLQGIKDYFTNIFEFGHIFQMVVLSFAVVWVLSPVIFNKKGVLTAFLKMAGTFAFIMVAEAFVIGLQTATMWRSLNGITFPLVYLLMIVLYAVFFSTFSNKYVRVIIAAVLFSCTVSVTELVKNICYTQTAVTGDTGIALLVMLVNSANIILALILGHFRIDKFKFISADSAAITLVSAIIVTVAIFVCSILGARYDMADNGIWMPFTVIMGVVMCLIVMLSFILLYMICEKNLHVLEVETEQTMTHADEEMMKIYERSVSEMREFRHDEKNRISYIRTLCENGQYDDLKTYLDSLGAVKLSAFNVIDCQNRVINNILNMEKAKAEAHGIGFATHLNVPLELPFSQSDLCSLFSNFVDNAIDSCEKSNLQNPEIDILTSIRQDYLYISIKNPLSENADKKEVLKLNTTKRESGHGYGTKIVRRIAESYNGYVNYDVEDGCFIADVMLNLLTSSKGAA